MSEQKVKLQCEACERWFILTFDPGIVEAKLLAIDCVCGHHTKAKPVPGLRVIQGGAQTVLAPDEINKG